MTRTSVTALPNVFATPITYGNRASALRDPSRHAST
jgi:hypothetical protein